MKTLPKARVARLAECHIKQKAGYDQHTSPIQPHTALFLNVLIQMKNDVKSDYTINFTRKSLAFLARHTDLTESEAVKHFIATLKNKKGKLVTNGYKRNLCIVYNHFCKYYKIQ